jgi:predicted RNase H-like HicB family nuclease
MTPPRSSNIPPRLEIAVVATEHHASAGDYRFSAEADAFPGCLSFGATKAEALRRCQAVVLRLLAEGMCRSDTPPLHEILFQLTEGRELPRGEAAY